MFTDCVRCLTSRSPVRCIDRAACWSHDFTGTNRIVGRVTALQIASASAEYDQTLEAFSGYAEASRYNWTQRVRNRVGTLKALHGRDRLRDALVRLGFALR